MNELNRSTMKDETTNALPDVTVPHVDITAILDDCASSLSVSDPFLCDNDTFNLHGSMAALELMDDKLDCCEIPKSVYTNESDCTACSVPPRPPPYLLEELPWEHLTLHDASTISLECLTRLESLLGGASIAESTSTCLYTHAAVMQEIQSRVKNTSLEDEMVSLLSQKTPEANAAQRAVKGAALGLVAISHVIQTIVFNADIYEDEDFTMHDCGLLDYFGDKDDELVALHVLDDVGAHFTQMDDEEGKTIGLVLGFMRDFLHVCISMASLSVTTVRTKAEQAKATFSSGQFKLNQLQSLISSRIKVEGDQLLVHRGFDPYVNRPLFGNTPMRKVAFKSPRECIDPLRQVFSEITLILCDILLSVTSLRQLRQKLERFSSSPLNILSRSLVVLNLYFDDHLLGQYPVIPMIADHLGVPRAIVESRYGKAFLSRLAKPVYDTLKLFMLNCNRQRGYIESIMLADWSILQQEAQVVDASSSKENGVVGSSHPYFSLYTLLTTVTLMERHVSLGIELKLFHGQYELTWAYWYRDFLFSSIRKTLKLMQQAKLEKITETRKVQNRKKGNKKNRVRESKREVETLQGPADEFDFMLVDLKREMSAGLVRFFAAFNQASLLYSPAYKFTSAKRIFEKRFEAFSGMLQPPALKYEDFVSALDCSGVAQQQLLLSACECFKRGRELADKLAKTIEKGTAVVYPIEQAELRNIAKVCVTNAVVIHKIIQQPLRSRPSKGAISIDLCTHKQFCTLSFKK